MDNETNKHKKSFLPANLHGAWGRHSIRRSSHITTNTKNKATQFGAQHEYPTLYFQNVHSSYLNIH